jgi:hypothetical protein
VLPPIGVPGSVRAVSAGANYRSVILSGVL